MSQVDQLMKEAIASNVFPGAALLVASRGKTVYRNFFGSATDKTIFDIASLTKPVATAAIALSAVREGRLTLDSLVSRFTLRHLLDHTSGLPAWRPYYEEIARDHPESVGKRESRRYYLEKISKEPLEATTGQRRIYSDLGFILLGIFLEDLLGYPLDQLFTEKISGPFGINDTFFLPVGEPLPRPIQTFAATEQSVWRKKLIRGEVHDDNAYTLGGVAGHAGLFSTVDDLHRFLVRLTTGKAGSFGSSGGVTRRIPMSRPGSPPPFPPIGWDTPTDKDSQAGKYFSKNSIGHLGFTGCSIWADLDRDFHVILLTNRVHPSSKNESIKKFRPQIHDLVCKELIRSKPPSGR